MSRRELDALQVEFAHLHRKYARLKRLGAKQAHVSTRGARLDAGRDEEDAEEEAELSSSPTGASNATSNGSESSVSLSLGGSGAPVQMSAPVGANVAADRGRSSSEAGHRGEVLVGGHQGHPLAECLPTLGLVAPSGLLAATAGGGGRGKPMSCYERLQLSASTPPPVLTQAPAPRRFVSVQPPPAPPPPPGHAGHLHSVSLSHRHAHFPPPQRPLGQARELETLLAAKQCGAGAAPSRRLLPDFDTVAAFQRRVSGAGAARGSLDSVPAAATAAGASAASAALAPSAALQRALLGDF